MIYLDNAATTMISPEVLEAMMPYFMDKYFNPGGMYPGGSYVRNAILNAREKVASLLSCDCNNIIFTSSGSEANNIAIKGTRKYNVCRDMPVILSSDIEHDSVIGAVESINDNVKIKILPDGTAMPSASYYEDNYKKIGMTSVMFVNNETGAINDVKSFCDIAHSYGSLFHMDCVQAVGCVIIDTSEIGCDFASISSHKIHGPKGVGALYVCDNCIETISPLINGGHEQEFGIRGGTENVPGIVGFGEACRILKDDLNRDIQLYKYLYDEFTKCILSIFKENGLIDNISINSTHSGKICSISIKDADAQTICMIAGQNGLCISPGSACRTTNSEASKTLLAMGMTPKKAYETIRISFSKYNSIDDITKSSKIIFDIYKMMLNGV